jgi:hypothetical protein
MISGIENDGKKGKNPSIFYVDVIWLSQKMPPTKEISMRLQVFCDLILNRWRLRFYKGSYVAWSSFKDAK